MVSTLLGGLVHLQYLLQCKPSTLQPLDLPDISVAPDNGPLPWDAPSQPLPSLFLPAPFSIFFPKILFLCLLPQCWHFSPFVFSVHLFFTGNFLHSQDMKNLYIMTTSMHRNLSPSDIRPIIQLSRFHRFKNKTFTSPTVPPYSVSVKYQPLVPMVTQAGNPEVMSASLISDLKKTKNKTKPWKYYT